MPRTGRIFEILILSALILINLNLSSAFNYLICHNSSDCVNYPLPNINQPSKGAAYTDPNTNMNVTRVTDAVNDAGESDFYLQYSRYSPVSFGNRYLITAQKKLYNLTDLSYMGEAPHVSGSDMWNTENCGGDMEYRWDYTGSHPTRLYYRYGRKFYQTDIITKQNQIIRDFKGDFPATPELCLIHNDDEGDSSANSRYWAFKAHGEYQSSIGRRPLYYIFVYDKDYDLYGPDDDGKPGKIISILNRSVMQIWGNISFSGLLAQEIDAPNFVDISPSGNKVLCSWGWHQGGANSPLDGPRIYNLDFTNPIKVGPTSLHSGWGYDTDGNEVYVAQDSSTDWVTMVDVNSGKWTRIIYHTEFGGWDVGGWHFSRTYNKSKKGWALVSFYDSDNNRWADNEIIMLELKDNQEEPRIWRIGSSQTIYEDYASEAFAANSLGGDKIFWGANWNRQDNLEIYTSELPYSWWEDLSLSSQQFHPADTNQNGKIEMVELIAFIGRWKAGSANVNDVLSALDRWFIGR